MRIIAARTIRQYYEAHPASKAALQDIKGNDFRLVAVVKFAPKFVLIRFIGTHAEYDKIGNIDNI